MCAPAAMPHRELRQHQQSDKMALSKDGGTAILIKNTTYLYSVKGARETGEIIAKCRLSE